MAQLKGGTYVGGDLIVAANLYASSLTVTSTAVITNLNADSVDGQHFSYANSSDAPTYLWGTNASGTNFLAARTGITVGYATLANGANGNFYIDDNFGNSIVGLYDPGKFQGVYAMGESYKLPADGASTGSFYGMAWSHPNAGGQAANLSAHGILLVENGTTMAALSTNIWCSGQFRGAGTGLTGTATSLSIGGNAATSSKVVNYTPHTSTTFDGSWNSFYTNYGYIQLGPANAGTAHIYTDRDSFYFNKPLSVNGTAISMDGHTHASLPNITISSGLTSSYIYMADSDEGERVIHCNSHRIGFLNQAGSWGAWCNDDGSWQADTMQATTFSGALSGNATTATSAGSISGWNNPPTGNNGGTWPHLVGVKSDGAFEVGQYMDFHTISNDGSDYINRITSSGGVLTASGQFTATQFNGPLVGNVTGNVSGNAATAGGLAVHTGRNNEVNKIVRTDASGYIQAGYINSDSGNENNASSPSRVWGTNGVDNYLRTYQTAYLSVSYAATAGGAPATDVYAWAKAATKPSYSATEVGLGNVSNTAQVTTTYNSSLNSDSRNSRGVTRLYRRDDDSDYSVQTNWTGTQWFLRGYIGDNFHAECKVSYADTAGSAPASDVSAWAKAATKPSYTATEVGSDAAGTARPAIDGTITYVKLASSLTGSATVTSTVNLSANGIGKITLSTNTAFSFTNYELNKTYMLVITANGFTPSWATAARHVPVEGNATFGTSGVFYVSLTCVDATASSEKLLTVIMKGA